MTGHARPSDLRHVGAEEDRHLLRPDFPHGLVLTYADETRPKIAIAVAVLIRGSSSRIEGPLAAGVAGHIDRRLREQNY